MATTGNLARSTLLICLGAALGSASMVWFYRSRPVAAASMAGRTEKSLPTDGRSQNSTSPSVSVEETSKFAREERLLGNYVLDLQIPDYVKRRAEMDREGIAEFMKVYGPVYEKMFVEMGVGAKQREQLLRHIELICQAKLDAKKNLVQLFNAQGEYDKRMKGLLGEKYGEYKHFEDGWKARKETSLMEEFAKKSSLPGIAPERSASLLELIQSHNAYSGPTLADYGGPFNEPRKPLRNEQAVQAVEEEQATLALNAAAAIQKAKEMGFSGEEIQFLEKYYESQNNYHERTLFMFNDPVGFDIKRTEERLAKMRTDPNTPPEELKKTEQYLQRRRDLAAKLAQP
ncbi:MAG: hypothetical protein QM715_05235 [Nibricoccus sp.]